MRDGATVGEALVRGRDRLRAFGDDGRFDALRLLEELLGRNAAWLFAHADERLGGDVAARYDAVLSRRATGMPVAYIVGFAGFYGREFAVTPDVLVPRPESEGVVELALASLQAHMARGDEPVRICDVGTGSGILAITLACTLPAARVTASDVSPAALAVARANAERHGVEGRVRFACGDMWEALDPDERYDCIVANLPYVCRGDLKTAPDATAFEPALARDGGWDGLELYRTLLAGAAQRLRPGGTLVMEAGPDTAGPLAALAEASFAPPAAIVVHRDLSLHDRIVAVHTALGGQALRQG